MSRGREFFRFWSEQRLDSNKLKQISDDDLLDFYDQAHKEILRRVRKLKAINNCVHIWERGNMGIARCTKCGHIVDPNPIATEGEVADDNDKPDADPELGGVEFHD